MDTKRGVTCLRGLRGEARGGRKSLAPVSDMSLFTRCTLNKRGCLLWQGHKIKNGYGRIHFGDGTMELVHRRSWQLANGQIPDGMMVCHKCDTPSCINPEHLFLGTHADNLADCISKGRHAHGKTHGRVKNPHLWDGQSRGENNGNAKLTEQDIIGIRASHSSSRSLSAQYGVSKGMINNIRSGRSWRHVGGG